MRVIKFRAWDSKRNKMFSPEEMGADELQLNPDGRGFFNAHCDNQRLSKYYPHLIPLQFTGFYDKKGVEVYEGDIFRVEEDGAEDGTDMIYYLVIVWIKEWGMFGTLRFHDEYQKYLIEGAKALDEPMFWTYTLEDTNDRRFYLDGNIYQNPKILVE